MAGPAVVFSPQARQTYLALYSIRRTFTTSASQGNSGGHFYRSDFTSQGFTGYYEPGGPTVGPLGDASAHGAPRVTPKMLKDHLDQFVVGQERAKKVLSVAVYNHYQRVQELQRREDELEELAAQQERRDLNKRHPVEDLDEFPGQQPTVHLYGAPHPPQTQPPHPRYQEAPRYASIPPPQPAPLLDDSPLALEKSNVLLLGPSGVGKTLMAKTLARVLEVPFSMSDCTPFTQAGYIGEDAEVCVQRLLAAANYDVARAERGIICLDEIDKIATAKVSHGKDVSGEGVQQALLKIIEGTTVQVQAKQERSSGGGSPRSHNAMGSYPSHNPMGGGGGSAGGSSRETGASSGSGTSNTTTPPPNKGEVYNVNTDNILFICSGAFIGLHKTVMDRIARGSIGFGARVRGSPISGDSTDPTLKNFGKEEEELFQKHVPFYTPPNARGASAIEEDELESIDLELDAEDAAAAAARSSSSPRAPIALSESSSTKTEPNTQITPTLNSLDLLTPNDLQTYGIIPELTGRLPVTCALTPLSTNLLVRVLAEPRNSLVAQYTTLFALSGIELRFTTPALREVAKGAQGMGTGARGLRTVMERLLGEAMFEAPGGQVRAVLVTAAAARREEPVRMFARGREDMTRFNGECEAEEAEWERRRDAVRRRRRGEPVEEERGFGIGGPVGGVSTFEQYRERIKVAGAG